MPYFIFHSAFSRLLHSLFFMASAPLLSPFLFSLSSLDAIFTELRFLLFSHLFFFFILILYSSSMEEPLPPDDLRCKRTDGRHWRCRRKIVDATAAANEVTSRELPSREKKNVTGKQSS